MNVRKVENCFTDSHWELGDFLFGIAGFYKKASTARMGQNRNPMTSSGWSPTEATATSFHVSSLLRPQYRRIFGVAGTYS